MKSVPAKSRRVLLALGVALFWFHCSTLGALAILDTAINIANGHTYYLLENSNWTDAENAAIGLGGHLVTINDAAENDWVWNRWATNRNLWIGLYAPTNAAPPESFRWASGESSAYRNWHTLEPNGDTATCIYAKGTSWSNYWNDIPASETVGDVAPFPFYGVVEIPSCTPHRARATATLVNGFVVAATVTDPGCGYANVPTVRIDGGGGSGAMAGATISNGLVIQITITNAGCCYTNPPDITISAPPMMPAVRIDVSKVKVTQNNLVEGWKYVLESSHDLSVWMATGPAFTAQSESITNEFDVDVTGRFFRLRVSD